MIQQQQSEFPMTKDKLSFFKYERRKQTSSFSQTHPFPEPSELYEFFTSNGSKMDGDKEVNRFSEEHVKNDIPIFHNNCRDLQLIFKTQKLKLQGEGWYSKQVPQVFQPDCFGNFSRCDH